ncbi:hypothetical protein LZ32DRAFT_399261 [Colletotrichum eremochloae]|nr:hypothetical protein LZ32DRAFT_399261 [Colletotrichum eremochloae]
MDSSQTSHLQSAQHFSFVDSSGVLAIFASNKLSSCPPVSSLVSTYVFFTVPGELVQSERPVQQVLNIFGYENQFVFKVFDKPPYIIVLAISQVVKSLGYLVDEKAPKISEDLKVIFDSHDTPVPRSHQKGYPLQILGVDWFSGFFNSHVVIVERVHVWLCLFLFSILEP